MKNPERIKSLFEKLYNGHPWLDVNLFTTLKNIPAGKAAARPLDNCNTIWEITVHIIKWRKNVLERVQGKVLITPGTNYIEPVKDTSEAAWAIALKELEATQHQWLAYLDLLQEEDFEKIYPNNKMTYYEHIHGIIHHDAYHLGQIVLLAKRSGK